MPPSDTRSRLLEAAARLFHAQGYAATGVAAILDEAKVRAGSLYHFFPGKSELLEATLRWRLAALRPLVTDPVEALTDDPIERLFLLLERYRQGLLMSGCARGCPIANLTLELADRHPPARELLQANFGAWIDVVAGWLETAGERLPRDVDRRELAGFALAVMEGGLMQSLARATTGPFDTSVAHLRRYFDLLAERARADGPAGPPASPPRNPPC